jgi:protein SCO1/2
MTRLYARLAVAALIALMIFVVIQTRRNGDQFADCRSGQIAGGAGAIGGPFTLTDQAGATVTDVDVITKPSLIYFGYTFCPDVCPLDNARNAEVSDILEEQGLEVTPIFISVDPRRDTPDVLAEYAANIHPRMIALTGTDEQIKGVTQAYKAYFKVQDDTDEYYLVDHSTFTYLVLPSRGFVEFFRRDDSADDMAKRVSCFVEGA